MDNAEFALWTAYDHEFGIPDANVNAAKVCAAAVDPHVKRRMTKLHFLPRAYHPAAVPVSGKENHRRYLAATAHLRKPK
jgi:hypothetical protein